MNKISVAVLIFSAAGLAVPWAFFALWVAIRSRIPAISSSAKTTEPAGSRT